MDDTEEPTNIFKFGAVAGGKSDAEAEDKIPHNDYVVIDNDDNEFDINGFLIFTPHHAAIMRDTGKGAIPVLVVPLNNVQAAFLDDDEDEVLD